MVVVVDGGVVIVAIVGDGVVVVVACGVVVVVGGGVVLGPVIRSEHKQKTTLSLKETRITLYSLPLTLTATHRSSE